MDVYARRQHYVRLLACVSVIDSAQHRTYPCSLPLFQISSMLHDEFHASCRFNFESMPRIHGGGCRFSPLQDSPRQVLIAVWIPLDSMIVGHCVRSAGWFSEFRTVCRGERRGWCALMTREYRSLCLRCSTWKASVGVYMITAFGISIPSSEPSTNFTTMSPITTVASNYTGVSVSTVMCPF